MTPFHRHLQSIASVSILSKTVRSSVPPASYVQMTSSSRKRSKQSLAVALLVPLVGIALAPPPARAGCAHGVTGSASRSSFGSLAGLEALNEAGALSVEPTPADSRRDRPCSGLACSEKRQLPHAPASSAPVRNDSWCRTTAALPPRVPESSHRNPVVIAAHPRHATSPPERPPRVGSPSTSS
jgi:hypothetical protein